MGSYLLRLDDEVLDRAKQAAEQQQRSLADWMRAAVTSKLQGPVSTPSGAADITSDIKRQKLAAAREAQQGAEARVGLGTAPGAGGPPKPALEGSTPSVPAKKRPYTHCENHRWRAGKPQESVCEEGCDGRQQLHWLANDPRG